MTEPPPPGPAAAPDAGVAHRVRSRTAASSAAFAVAGALLAALGWWRPGWFVGAAGATVGACAVALCVTAALVLARRAAAWARAERCLAGLGRPAPPVGGATTAGLGASAPVTIGAAVPLHVQRPGSPPVRVGRRLQAHVLPLRAGAGALAQGQAVVVHPREDGLLPRPGDQATVQDLGRRGPFLVVRADGVVFVADSWPLSTW